jgi:hypothetical protein
VRAGPELDAAVRRIVGADEPRIERVEHHALKYDAFLAGREIACVEGTARVGTRTVPWSFIEKRTEGPAVASAYLYDNARRELEAYRSGLLDDLAPDLQAPRLLAAAEEADGSLTLWIEDLEATARRLTSRDDILSAARHLGRLSGRWLGSVPDEEWLFTGWIERHSQPEAMRDAVALVNEAMAVPAVESRLRRGLDEVATLIADQGTFAAALRRLPVTLCHHDAVAANVFRRETADGAETVLIDWNRSAAARSAPIWPRCSSRLRGAATSRPACSRTSSTRPRPTMPTACERLVARSMGPRSGSGCTRASRCAGRSPAT